MYTWHVPGEPVFIGMPMVGSSGSPLHALVTIRFDPDFSDPKHDSGRSTERGCDSPDWGPEPADHGASEQPVWPLWPTLRSRETVYWGRRGTGHNLRTEYGGPISRAEGGASPPAIPAQLAFSMRIRQYRTPSRSKHRV